MCILLYIGAIHTAYVCLLGELKASVLSLTDLIIPLASTSAPSPFLFPTIPLAFLTIRMQCSATAFPQFLPSTGWASEVWEKLKNRTRNMSDTHLSGEELLPSCIPHLSAPVMRPFPYFSVFVSSMSQVSFRGWSRNRTDHSNLSLLNPFWNLTEKHAGHFSLVTQTSLQGELRPV